MPHKFFAGFFIILGTAVLIYQVENGFDRLGMGREDEYFWKTSKERQTEEKNDTEQ